MRRLSLAFPMLLTSLHKLSPALSIRTGSGLCPRRAGSWAGTQSLSATADSSPAPTYLDTPPGLPRRAVTPGERGPCWYPQAPPGIQRSSVALNAQEEEVECDEGVKIHSHPQQIK